MIVRVEYTGQIRTAAGRDAVEVRVADDTTLGGLLTSLAEAGPPGLRPHLLAHDGRIQPTLVVASDGHALAGQARETTVLHDDAAVVLLPPVAGG
jgi:molybdopterin converting factor small subunit